MGEHGNYRTLKIDFEKHIKMSPMDEISGISLSGPFFGLDSPSWLSPLHCMDEYAGSRDSISSMVQY